MERSVVAKFCREVVGTGLVEKHCREVLEKTVVEKCWGRVVEKCWGRMLEDKGVGKC